MKSFPTPFQSWSPVSKITTVFTIQISSLASSFCPSPFCHLYPHFHIHTCSLSLIIFEKLLQIFQVSRLTTLPPLNLLHHHHHHHHHPCVFIGFQHIFKFLFGKGFSMLFCVVLNILSSVSYVREVSPTKLSLKHSKYSWFPHQYWGSPQVTDCFIPEWPPACIRL